MRMNWVRYAGQEDILHRTKLDSGDYDAVVGEILRQVRERGDEAVAEYTERFDHAVLTKTRVSQEEIDEAVDSVGEGFMNILKRAKERITAYHEMQKRQSMICQEQDGSMTGLLFRPRQRRCTLLPS